MGNLTSTFVYATHSGKARLLPAVSLAVFSLVSGPAFSQGWTATNGPLSGEVTAVAITAEGLVVAGTAGKGLFLKEALSSTWTRATAEAFDGITVRAIIEWDDMLVVATSGRGIWRSGNDGVTWSGLNAGLGSQIVHALLGSNDGRLYAGTSSGLYRLGDNDLWLEIRGGAQGHDIRAITEDGNGTLFAGSFGRGILRSSDLGLSWDLLVKGLATNIIRTLAVNTDNEIFVGTFGGHVIQRSEDGGDTWIDSGDSLETQGVWTIAISPDGTYYAGTIAGGIFRSADGRTWGRVNAPISTVSGFAFSEGRVLAAMRVGLMSSRDQGQSWFIDGIPFSRVNALHIQHGRVFAGLQLGGVHYTGIAGSEWEPSSLDNAGILRFAEDSKGNLLAGTFDAGLFKSEDGGLTWDQIWKTIRVIYSIAFDSSDVVMVGTESGVFRFVEQDATWHRAGPTGIPMRSILALPSGVVLAGSERESIWRFSDGLETWQQVAPELVGSDIWIWDLVERPGGQIAAATISQGIWLSDDEGLSWYPMPGTGDVAIADLTISGDGDLFAVGFLGQVFTAPQGSNVASVWNEPFLSSPVRAIAIPKPGTVLIGTEPLGVYRAQVVADAVPDPDPVTRSSRLEIYPNPASATVTLHFESDRPGRAQWELVDVLGRKVVQAADRSVLPGPNDTQLDVSTLPSGIYWIRLLDDRLGETQSLLIAR